MNEIYQEHILDHYSSKKHRGVIEGSQIYARDTNPLCGDEVAVYGTVSKSKLEKMNFVARGCAISQAAASMLAEHVEGKDLFEISQMSNDEMVAMLMIPISATRRKCAVLALMTLKEGIQRYTDDKA